MAIFSGIISRLRGSIGQLTFARVGGKTVVREKVERKAVPTRTRRQMRRRVVWANLVNLYRAFSGTLHPSFENKERGRSDYNEFMSAAQQYGGMSEEQMKPLMYNRFGGTFYYEYFFTRNQKSY